MELPNKELANELENLIREITIDELKKSINVIALKNLINLIKEITVDELKKSIDVIVPEIDKIISIRIKEHFKILAKYLVEKTEE